LRDLFICIAALADTQWPRKNRSFSTYRTGWAAELMAMISFTSNATDHSTDKGYQFELRQVRQRRGVPRSSRAKRTMAGGLPRAASSLFGGSSLGGAADATDYLRDQTRGSARDDAMARPSPTPSHRTSASARGAANGCV
jgi:hypothetical protein